MNQRNVGITEIIRNAPSRQVKEKTTKLFLKIVCTAIIAIVTRTLLALMILLVTQILHCHVKNIKLLKIASNLNLMMELVNFLNVLQYKATF